MFRDLWTGAHNIKCIFDNTFSIDTDEYKGSQL